MDKERKWTDREALETMIKDGKKLREMALELNCSIPTVCNHLKKYNLRKKDRKNLEG